MKELKRTWAEISLDNLKYNMDSLMKPLPEGCRFLGVVKADAYGHGAVAVSRELERLGAGYLAVSNYEEALQLRREDIRLPILILGYTPPEFAPELSALNITQEIHCLSYGKELSEKLQGRELKVHLKVDTGMSRLGFFAYDRPETLPELEQVYALPGIRVEGIFMHFAVSDDPGEEEYTRLQYQRFMTLVNGLKVRPEIVHCCNSGGTVAYPAFCHDMVRPGIATYGLAPSAELAGMCDLKPLMSFKTTVAAIRPFSEGITVSYGRTYKTPADRIIAVCPVGYADGFNRRLTGQVEVLLHGKRVPVVGRICMDMCMIDITDVPETQVGDTVTLVGTDGNETISWDDWAEKLGTISYELVCSVNKRVPRVYLRNNEVVDTLRYII